jgi:enoyl-[acyl-carrier-protein] reductase (NADH)
MFIHDFRLEERDTEVVGEEDARRVSWDVSEEQTLVDFLKQQKLQPNLIQYIVYALAFAETDQLDPSSAC